MTKHDIEIREGKPDESDWELVFWASPHHSTVVTLTNRDLVRLTDLLRTHRREHPIIRAQNRSNRCTVTWAIKQWPYVTQCNEDRGHAIKIHTDIRGRTYRP